MAVALRGCGKTAALGGGNIPDDETTREQPAFRFSAPVLAEETRSDPAPSSEGQNKHTGSGA